MPILSFFLIPPFTTQHLAPEVLKELGYERLGKFICGLISGVDSVDLDLSHHDVLTKVMILEFRILGTWAHLAHRFHLNGTIFSFKISTRFNS